MQVGTTKDAQHQRLYRQWVNYYSPCRSILLSNINPFLESRSYNYKDTEFGMQTNPSDSWANLGNIRFLRHGSWLQWQTSWMEYLAQEIFHNSKPTPYWIAVSPTILKPTASNNPLLSKIPPPPPWNLPLHRGCSSNYPDTKTWYADKLVHIGFYFWLRSYKHTKYTGYPRTFQFRPLLDFIFFVGYRLLPDYAPI